MNYNFFYTSPIVLNKTSNFRLNNVSAYLIEQNFKFQIAKLRLNNVSAYIIYKLICWEVDFAAGIFSVVRVQQFVPGDVGHLGLGRRLRRPFHFL